MRANHINDSILVHLTHNIEMRQCLECLEYLFEGVSFTVEPPLHVQGVKTLNRLLQLSSFRTDFLPGFSGQP